MKFTTSAAIALAATGAVAQIDVLKPLFADVGKAIDALDSAAKSFNGDVDAVSSKADALIKSIKDGDKKAQGSKDLELADALGLQAPVKDLTEKGTTLESDFKAKVSDIEKAGACGTVREKLADINDASKAFIKTVVAKVPDAAQDIAAGLAAGLTKVLDQAQDDFSEANCKDSGSSKPSGGASETGGASQTGGASETAAPTGGESSAPATTAAPTQTGGAGDCHTCQGGNGTAPGPTSTPVVAGAGALAPAGALVLAVAAALL